MNEETNQNQAKAVPVDWVSALFQAIGSTFEFMQTAVMPGVLSAQAYFQQLLNAQPTLQDANAGTDKNRRDTDRILILSGIGIIVLLIIAIILKKK